MVTPAHADSTTFWRLYGRPRRSSMRSVSRDRLLSVLSPAISQNRCPNSESGLYANSAGLRSFSIRIVARPLNGEALLTVGVVEYRAKIESLAHGPPAGRHTVPTYCGRSDTSYTMISTRKQPHDCTTRYVSIRKLGRSCRHASRRTPVRPSMTDSWSPPELAKTIVSPESGWARSRVQPREMMLLVGGFAGTSAPGPGLALRRTSVGFPAETSSVSNTSGPAPPIVSTRNPIHEIALGSVAWMVMASFTSTRVPTMC